MKLVIETLNLLLEKFDLPANIFGYIALLSAFFLSSVIDTVYK